MFKPIIFLVFGFFFLLQLTSTETRADTKPCDAVDRLAEVVYSTEQVTVGMFSSSSTKFCRFTVNSVPKFASLYTKTGIKRSLDNIVYLKNYARSTLSAPDRSKFSEVIERFAQDLVYILAAPGLDSDGFVPKKLDEIVTNQTDLLKACFKDFYTGGAPKWKSDQLTCEILQSSKDTLNTTAAYEDVIYALYTFR